MRPRRSRRRSESAATDDRHGTSSREARGVSHRARVPVRSESGPGPLRRAGRGPGPGFRLGVLATVTPRAGLTRKSVPSRHGRSGQAEVPRLEYCRGRQPPVTWHDRRASDSDHDFQVFAAPGLTGRLRLRVPGPMPGPRPPTVAGMVARWSSRRPLPCRSAHKPAASRAATATGPSRSRCHGVVEMVD